MADIVFNVAKGSVAAYHNRVNDNDPANSAIIQVLLKTVQADATLRDYDTLDAILTAGGGTVNVECDFTNYARKTLSDAAVVAVVIDDTNDRAVASIDDWVIASAGGATNNTVLKLLNCYDPDTTAGTDSTIIPLTAHDLTETTNGQQLTIAPTTVQEYYRAS